MYNFNEKEILALNDCWMINWCWWKWWIDFWLIVKTLFEQANWFETEEFYNLWYNFTLICNEHDFDFRIQVWFYRANFRMAIKTYKLIKKWAWKKEAFIVSSTIFALLNKYWKEYYEKANWKNNLINNK